MDRLKDQVVLITGGSRGQGRAMALKFASEGANIAICDINRDLEKIPYSLGRSDEMEETRSRVEALGRECLAIEADVRSLEDMESFVEQTVDRFGKVDGVCASAGVHSFTPVWEMSPEEWQQVIDVNLTGVWNTVRAAAPQFVEQCSGAIVLTSSVMGRETGKDLAHYAASKHGVLGLNKSFAYELGPHNVRCNAILPSAVHDKMGDNPETREWMFGRPNATTDEYVEATRHWHALRGRAALPAAAIADVAMFLLSDEAAYISGAEILADAGHSVVPPYNTQPVYDENVEVGPYSDDGISIPQEA